MGIRNAARPAHRFDGGEPRDCVDLLGGGIKQSYGTFQRAFQLTVGAVGSGRYAALLDGKNICISRQPLLDSARALLKRGYDPSAILEMYRRGDRVWAVRGSIGAAARLTVDESRTSFAPWKAFCSAAVSSPMRQIETAATLHHLGAI